MITMFLHSFHFKRNGTLGAKLLPKRGHQVSRTFPVIMWSSCSLRIKIYKVSGSDILSLSEMTNSGDL